LGSVLQLRLAGISDDADDFDRLLNVQTDTELLAESIWSGIVAVHKSMVDDGDGQGVETVAVIEVAHTDYRGTHGLEIARANDEELGRWRVGRRRSGLVRIGKTGARDPFRERKKVSRSGGLNARCAADFSKDSIEVLGALEIIVITRGRGLDVHGQKMFRTETGIDGDETREAAKHEA